MLSQFDLVILPKITRNEIPYKLAYNKARNFGLNLNKKIQFDSYAVKHFFLENIFLLPNLLAEN